MGQNEYGGAEQVTGNFYLYAKNLGTHEINVFILPLE